MLIGGAQSVDGAVGFVLCAPPGLGGRVCLEDWRSEVVGEGPVGRGGRYVELGYWMAVEPDVLVGDRRRTARCDARLGQQVHPWSIERVALAARGDAERRGGQNGGAGQRLDGESEIVPACGSEGHEL